MRRILIVLMALSIIILGIVNVKAEEVDYNVYSFNTLTEYEDDTGNTIDNFNGAPELKDMVEQGEIPEIKERLPEEPLVVEPDEEIGQYGGTLKTGATGPEWGGGDDWQLRAQFLTRLTSDLTTVVPNIAKDWEFSDDNKVVTFYLREGMKWSDGHPFTTEDVKFWYEDVLLNDDLTPSIPDVLVVGGEPVQVDIIDDYTFSMSFAEPYLSIVNLLSLGVVEPYEPKHYLKQYHKEYNEEVEDIAKEEGYESWMDLYDRHNISNFGQQQRDPDCPTLYPWMLEEVDDTSNRYYVRNPYYFKVDTEGNQLPYIDEQQRLLVEDTEVFGLKSIAGDFTAAGQWLGLSDIPLYKREKEKGDYRVELFDGAGNQGSLSFNYSYKEDDVLREIFNDVRFRKAVSLSIDREEINKQFFFERGITRQATADPTVSFYEDWMGEYYTERDLDQAHELLDEMGLEWDENEEYRLRPDGEVLSFQLFTSEGEFREDIGELLADYMTQIGIDCDLKLVDRSLLVQRKEANKLPATLWNLQEVNEFSMYVDYKRASPAGPESAARGWYDYFFTSSEGVEPVEEAKKVVELMEKWQLAEPGSEEYNELGKEFLTIYTENLWDIGTVGLVPSPVIISNDVVNAPYEGVWAWGYRRFLPYSGDQWYFENN